MTTPIPRFHDACVTGIGLLAEAIVIIITDVDGSEHEIKLHGVEAFQLDDFCQQNIISLVEVVVGRKPDADTKLERLIRPPHASAAVEYHVAHGRAIDRTVNRIESGDVCLFSIIPSWDADLIAICRQVTSRSI